MKGAMRDAMTEGIRLKTRIYRIVFVALLSCIPALLTISRADAQLSPCEQPKDFLAKVSFLWVGQGAATLVQCRQMEGGNGSVRRVLVDAGAPDSKYPGAADLFKESIAEALVPDSRPGC